jgi:dolichol kinase
MRKVRKEEIQRKVLHLVFGALIPAGILYIPMYAGKMVWLPPALPGWIYPPAILLATFLVWIILETARMKSQTVNDFFHKCLGSMLREEESDAMTGATYIILSSLICSIIFKDHALIAAMVLSTFIWGDAVAALVGQSMGRIKIGKKSLEGSLACFVLCLLSFFLIFPVTPHLLTEWKGAIPPVLAIIASLCVTVLELFPIQIRNFVINDNLIVPIVTGLVMLWLYPVLR